MVAPLLLFGGGCRRGMGGAGATLLKWEIWPIKELVNQIISDMFGHIFVVVGEYFSESLLDSNSQPRASQASNMASNVYCVFSQHSSRALATHTDQCTVLHLPSTGASREGEGGGQQGHDPLIKNSRHENTHFVTKPSPWSTPLAAYLRPLLWKGCRFLRIWSWNLRMELGGNFVVFRALSVI